MLRGCASEVRVLGGLSKALLFAALTLFFTPPHHSVQILESGGIICIPVKRVNGCKGTLEVDFRTKDGSATAPHDYIGASPADPPLPPSHPLRPLHPRTHPPSLWPSVIVGACSVAPLTPSDFSHSHVWEAHIQGWRDEEVD